MSDHYAIKTSNSNPSKKFVYNFAVFNAPEWKSVVGFDYVNQDRKEN